MTRETDRQLLWIICYMQPVYLIAYEESPLCTKELRSGWVINQRFVYNPATTSAADGEGCSKQGPRPKPWKNFSGSLDLKPANAIIRLIHCCFLWTSEFQRGKKTSHGTPCAAQRRQKSTRTSLLSTSGRWGYPGKELEPLGAHFQPSPSGRSKRQHR